MSLHKLSLFVWAIFVTAFLLLLSLPVLAGVPHFFPFTKRTKTYLASDPSLSLPLKPKPKPKPKASCFDEVPSLAPT